MRCYKEKKKREGRNYLGEITFYLVEISTDLHFCFQSLKYDILLLKTFKLWQFDHFDIFFPKMPLSHFLFFYFFEKKRNMQGWPNHPSIFLYFYFFVFVFVFLDFFKNKIKYVIGALWEKKGQSGWIATIWKFGRVKCHILNFGGKSENGWIL